MIAGFGKIEPFENFASAEARLGWKIMRPADERFYLVRRGGLLRSLEAGGLPRIEQAYGMSGREGLIEIVQAPETYPQQTSETPEAYAIEHVQGVVTGKLPHGSFSFFSSQNVRGERIRVTVYTNRSSDLSEDDFVAFVSSLTIPSD